MAEPKLFELIKLANPVPDSARLLLRAQDADALFAEVMDRLGIPHSSVTALDPPEETTLPVPTQAKPIRPTGTSEPPRRTRRLARALAVAAAVLIATMIVLPLMRDPAQPANPGPTPRVGGDFTMDILMLGPNNGDFTTAGNADVCEEGVLTNVDAVVTDSEWTWEDEYTCDDESGSFIVSGEFNVDPEVQSPATLEGTWTISGGTGAYEDLEGSGTIAADFAPLWRETYVGELRYPSPPPR